MSNKTQLRYEDAAVRVTGLSGWACVQCGRFFGDDKDSEELARYCCYTDGPCECGGRSRRGRTCCDECSHKRRLENFLGLKEVDWDGETPLVGYCNDNYFFSPEQLGDHLGDEYGDDITAKHVEDMQLVLCVRHEPSQFEMDYYLSDDLPEDGELPDTTEIDKLVNDWIDANLPQSWESGNVRVTTESVLKAIGIEVKKS